MHSTTTIFTLGEMQYIHRSKFLYLLYCSILCVVEFLYSAGDTSPPQIDSFFVVLCCSIQIFLHNPFHKKMIAPTGEQVLAKEKPAASSSIHYGVLFGSLSIFMSVLGASLTFPYLQGWKNILRTVLLFISM